METWVRGFPKGRHFSTMLMSQQAFPNLNPTPDTFNCFFYCFSPCLVRVEMPGIDHGAAWVTNCTFKAKIRIFAKPLINQQPHGNTDENQGELTILNAFQLILLEVLQVKDDLGFGFFHDHAFILFPHSIYHPVLSAGPKPKHTLGEGKWCDLSLQWKSFIWDRELETAFKSRTGQSCKKSDDIFLYSKLNYGQEIKLHAIKKTKHFWASEMYKPEISHDGEYQEFIV